MTKAIANKSKTKPKGNPNWKKGGTSPNPSGRPKDGQSWREVITDVSNMTIDDILVMVGRDNELGMQLAKMPKNLQMKYMVTARVMAALMFEPTAGLWNGLMDRMEGKVAERLQIEGNLEVENLDKVLGLVYGESKDSS